MAEMYFQGVSRRKVKAVTEELCGHSVSAGTISNLVKKLDASLEAFAGRRLEEPYPYVILDARYEKVRAEGMSQSRAVLVALGVDAEVATVSWTLRGAVGAVALERVAP